MTALEKLQLEQSTIRSQLNTALALSEAERGADWQTDMDKLTTRASALETEMRAVLVLGSGDDDDDDDKDKTTTTTTTTTESKEDLERRELAEKIEFGNYITAALGMHGVTGGAEAEYNAEHGLPSDAFPLELLTRGMEPELETRAAIDGDAKASQGTWLDRLFSDSAAARLGITMPIVAPGIANYPVMSAGGNPIQRNRAEAVSASTYTVAVTELKPTRKAVHAIYSIEDNARLPGLADGIARDMRLAMVEKVDRDIFVGDSGASGTSADIAGLNTATITEVTLTQANKVKGSRWMGLFAAMIDGKYAVDTNDLRIVMSVGANTLLMSTVDTAAVSLDTAAQFLRNNGINWTARGDIETATATGDFGAFVGRARGQAGSAVAPMWAGGSLVRDPYTSAKNGEVQLTLSYLWNFGIPRGANYRRIKFVT